MLPSFSKVNLCLLVSLKGSERSNKEKEFLGSIPASFLYDGCPNVCFECD
jgi:hypothetical protein